jgi:CAAX protease family protein
MPTLRAWEEEWRGLPAAGRALWLALRVFGSVPIVPVAEELAFRGYLLGRLQAREFLAVPFERWIPWAVLVSSAAFGAIHAGWLGGTLAGLMFAIVQIRGRSLPTPSSPTWSATRRSRST